MCTSIGHLHSNRDSNLRHFCRNSSKSKEGPRQYHLLYGCIHIAFPNSSPCSGPFCHPAPYLQMLLVSDTNELLWLTETRSFLKKFMQNRNAESCPPLEKSPTPTTKSEAWAVLMVWISCSRPTQSCNSVWLPCAVGRVGSLRRLMLCVAVRWQDYNSELISHESGASPRGFERQWHFRMMLCGNRPVKPRVICF